MIQDIRPPIAKIKTLTETLEDNHDFIIYGNTKKDNASIITGTKAIKEDITLIVDSLLQDFIRT